MPVTYVSTGVITLTATVTDCIESYSVTKTLLIGAAVGGYYTITSNYHYSGTQYTLYNNNSPIWLPANQGFGVSVNLTSPGLISGTWTRSPSSYPFNYSPSGIYLSFSGTSGSTAYEQRNGIFNLSAQTQCGSFNGTYTWPVIVAGWLRIMVTPNPATDYITVSIEETSAKSRLLNRTENVSVSLYDFNSNMLVRKWEFRSNQKKFNLNISDIKKGQYILVVRKGKEQGSKLILVE